MESNRKKLYGALQVNTSKVKFIDGKNKGKKGLLIHKSKLNNSVYYCSYIKYQFHNYFSVKVKVGKREMPTSCNNIVLI